MTPQRIAVTGGNGMVGHAIVTDLMADREVTALDITQGRPGVRARHADIMSPDDLRSALESHDAIVHLAAMLQPTDPEDRLFRVNTLGTWNVLEAARELGISKFVLISSECASGIINVYRRPPPAPDYLPVDEAHELRPPETYGLSKQVAEITAQSFARRGGMQIVALRPTLILNPTMGDYVERVRTTDDPDLWSYVELMDVVQGVRRALDYDGPPFDALYLSARDTFGPEATIAFMERRFGRRFEIRDERLYRDNPHAAIWDLRRAEKLLGFKPESDWRRLVAARN